MYKQIKLLWNLIDSKRKRECYSLIGLMVLASISEVVSIGAVVPFLAILSAPEFAYEKLTSMHLLEGISINAPTDLVLPMVILFCVLSFASGSIRLFLLSRINEIAFAIGADISQKAYKKTLYISYETHCLHNSSELISGLTNKTNAVIYNMVLPMLTIVSSALLIVSIVIAMILVDPIIAIASFSSFAFIYLVVAMIVKNRLQQDSKIIAVESSKIVQNLQESLGAIRDIIIDGTQDAYFEKFKDSDIKLRKAQGTAVFLSQAPKYGVESLGIIAISVIAYIGSSVNDSNELILPVLGMIALGAQRLLPILQQAYWSWSNALGCKESLIDVVIMLTREMPVYYNDDKVEEPANIEFNNCIAFENLSYKYTGALELVLGNVCLQIKKGSIVGIVGPTGSGKSTFVDVVMGLLKPTSGNLKVDNLKIDESNVRSWQKKIAHVPQSIFLVDGTVAENIAFGVNADEVEIARLHFAAKKACIFDVINSMSDGFETLVGENGVKLSGGQRQRIGIARAIYKNAEFIVLDEATSALDNETERQVISNIMSLDKKPTTLMIAHRLSTLSDCDYIVNISDGKAKIANSVEDLHQSLKLCAESK